MPSRKVIIHRSIDNSPIMNCIQNIREKHKANKALYFGKFRVQFILSKINEY